MEHEVEGLVLADLGADRSLDLAQDLGAQLDCTGLVRAVHVAEREGRHVAALLADAECLDRRETILGRGVQLVVDLGRVAVLFATDNADLDLEDGVRGLRQLEQFHREREVLRHRHGRAVPHVRLEDGQPACLHAFGRRREQRTQPGVDVVGVAVVGVQRDGDAIGVGYLTGVGGERERARPPGP